MTEFNAAARHAGYTDGEAARAERALTAWASALRPEFSADEVARAAAPLAAAAAPTAPPARSTVGAWRRRGVFSVVGAGALALAFAGTAAAADGAAPGDALYSIDRVLESVGIGDGGLDERLDEVEALEERGEDDLAGETLAGALDDEGLEEAATGVRHALDQVSQNGSEASAETHERVGAMLDAIQNARENGESVGAAASAAARGLTDIAVGDADAAEGQESAGEPTDGDEAPGNSGSAPGKPEDAPGNSGGAPGKSDDAPGNSGDAPGNSGSAPGRDR